ncbi:thioredoxin family protein [Clostridium estertheticum]|uniref:thioredoxin family protein n=1 Tax=Clostridium estertheticum TaxID=238834 RepID=UPI001C0E350C|nr:thioredoxin family protein [Clostridium estertheticum]MBU3076063.1 thioredoxin family protein [Clostridium estertheticum]MBU3166212.1 thioredoxin family protein [Clostridium estertheticum]
MRKNLLGLLLVVLCIGAFIGYKYLIYKPLNSINQKEIQSIVTAKKDAIIYIGRPSCPDCKKFKPELEKVLKDNHSSIYYFNIESTGKQKQLIREYLKGLGIDYIPIVIVIENGKVKEYLKGEMDFQKLKKIITN